MKIIYIHIEITAREYYPKLLLSYLAAKAGYLVILGDVLKFFSKNTNYSGIFHFKDIAPSTLNIDLFQKLKKKGFLITSIDEEGGIEYKKFDSEKSNSFLKLRFSDKTIKLVDKVFTWGQFDFKSLIENFKIYSDKIVKSGNPRYDYCKNKLDFFYNYKKNLGQNINQEKKPILIVSDLGTIMQEKPIWDQFKIVRDAYFQNDDLNDYEFELYNNYANKTLYLGELIKLTRKLIKKFPDERFIFRPHPSESAAAWKKIIGEYENLKIVEGKTSIHWIRKCKLMIHNSCYTSFEASLLKKPIISFCPEQCKEYRKFFSAKLGLQVRNFEETENYLSSFLKDKNFFENNILANFELAQERIHFSDNLSSNLILNEWNNISKDQKKMTKIEYVKFRSYLILLKVPYLIRSFIKKIFKIFNYKFKSHSKFIELNQKSIKNDLNLFENEMNTKNKQFFKVNKFDKNLCLIEIR